MSCFYLIITSECREIERDSNCVHEREERKKRVRVFVREGRRNKPTGFLETFYVVNFVVVLHHSSLLVYNWRLQHRIDAGNSLFFSDNSRHIAASFEFRTRPHYWHEIFRITSRQTPFVVEARKWRLGCLKHQWLLLHQHFTVSHHYCFFSFNSTKQIIRGSRWVQKEFDMRITNILTKLI